MLREDWRRERRMRILRCPESEERRRLFVTLRRAVSVLFGAESRLKSFVEVIGGEMGFQLGSNNTFLSF